MNLIIKNILLYYTPKSLISAIRKSSPIVCLHRLPDMGVHRKSIQMVKRKQANAVCYLLSNAVTFK